MYLQRLQKFALLEVLDPKINALRNDVTDGPELLQTVTWFIKSLKTNEAIDYSNQDMLEYISKSAPSSLKLTPSDISPVVRRYMRQEWEKRKLPLNFKKLAISNNPYICTAVGLLYMCTLEVFDANGLEVTLVASWLRVASIMVQSGTCPSFFTGLGPGRIRALPDLFCDLNISSKSSRKTCYESIEIIGGMIETEKYEPSLSNVLQVACILKRCSSKAITLWNKGAEVVTNSLKRSSIDLCDEIRPGLSKTAFSQILDSSFDTILASLCVSVFSGNPRGNEVAPCIPLLISDGQFVGLRTSMLKWVIPPNVEHSLIFEVSGNNVKVGCAVRNKENAWLRNLYLLNQEDSILLEECSVFSDEKYGDTQYIVKNGEIAFRTTPINNTMFTWTIDYSFDETQSMNVRKTHSVLYQHGIQTIPLLGFNILSKDGRIVPMDSGLKKWQKLIIK